MAGAVAVALTSFPTPRNSKHTTIKVLLYTIFRASESQTGVLTLDQPIWQAHVRVLSATNDFH